MSCHQVPGIKDEVRSDQFHSGTYFLFCPGKGKSGARLKCPMRKIATVPMMKSKMAAQKHTLSIIFPIRTQFSISFIWREKKKVED